MNNPLKQSNRAAKKVIAADGRWLMGESAIVADNDDPERQHRVRVIIPSIDEDMIYDQWARQMVFCLGDGYGSAFIPPKNSEVALFGQLGQKYNLFYASLYNEEMLMPSGFADENNVGIKAPENLTFIAEKVAKILAENFEAIAEQSAKMKGESATVEATATALLKGATINVNGTTISINASGAISIHGAVVAITSTGSVTIEGRMVNKAGPPI